MSGFQEAPHTAPALFPGTPSPARLEPKATGVRRTGRGSESTEVARAAGQGPGGRTSEEPVGAAGKSSGLGGHVQNSRPHGPARTPPRTQPRPWRCQAGCGRSRLFLGWSGSEMQTPPPCLTEPVQRGGGGPGRPAAVPGIHSSESPRCCRPAGRLHAAALPPWSIPFEGECMGTGQLRASL